MILIAYIRKKTIRGHGPYYYEVKSKRKPQGPRQKHIKYLGKSGYGSQIGTTRRGIFNQRIKHDINMNGTELWYEPDISKDTKSKVDHAYDKAMTNGQRNSILFLETYENQQPEYTHVGVKGSFTITAGGTYEDTRKRIRLFKPGKWEQEQANRILSHEGGHDSYHRLKIKSNKENQEVQKVNKKQNDKLSRQYNKLRDKEEKEFKEMNEMRGKVPDKEFQEQAGRYNKARDDVGKFERKLATIPDIPPDPVKHRHFIAMKDFEDASYEEKALTDYADIYRKEAHPNYVNENLAEAYGIWHGVGRGEWWKDKHPETYKAWKKIYEMDQQNDF